MNEEKFIPIPPLSEKELIENNIPAEEWIKITDKIVPYVLPYYWVSTYGNVYSEYTGQNIYQTKSKTNGGHMNVCLSLYTG